MEKATKSQKNKYWILFGIGLLIGLFLLGYLLRWNRGQPDIEISAEYVDENHIALTGQFVVTTDGDLGLDELYERLSFDPAMEFSLKPDDEGGGLLLHTYLPLEAGKTVVIILSDAKGKEQRRWEFLTEDTFKVLGTFPADAATDVPPDVSIEITLSYKDIDKETIGDFVTLSTEIDARFMIRNNTLIIVPKEPYLPAMTAIEVTVSADLPRTNGDNLGQDYSFSFTTGLETDQAFRMSSTGVRVTENYPADDDILLKLQLGDNLVDQPLTTTVYRYAGSDDYQSALRSYLDAIIAQEYTTAKSGWSTGDYWQVDTDGLEEVMKFSAPAVQLLDISFEQYVLLPETLEQGWYAAKVEATLPSGGTTTASKLIQITPISVYFAQSGSLDRKTDSRMVAWINSTETGSPINNAKVSVSATNYKVKGETDGDGLAVLEGKVGQNNREDYETQQGLRRNYSARVTGLLAVQDGQDVFYDIYGDGREYFRAANKENDYLSYLFSDRPVYRHTDTIKVWGLLKPRLDDGIMPTGVYLDMLEGAVTVPIEPNADGTFQTEFKIDAMSGKWVDITIKDDEDTSYNSLRVKLEDYIKPLYQTSATPDKPVYTAWGAEEGGVGIDFTASYFEGTPAQAYQAVARVDDEYAPSFPEVSLVTDVAGKTKFVIHPAEPTNERYIDSWRPQNIIYGVFSDQELNAPQVQGGSIAYLYRDTMITLEKGGDGRSVTAQVNKVDISRIRSEADLLVDDNLRGAAVETELTAEVHKVFFEKTPSGEKYDMINKISVTAYDQEYVDKVVDTLTATSTDGRAVFSQLPNDDKYASYYLKVIATDARGLRVAEDLYYNQVIEDWWGGVTHNYKLVKREPVELPVLKPSEFYDPKFSDDETMKIYLTDQGEEVSDTQGRLLHLTNRSDILDYGISGTEGFELPFDERYVPDYMMCGAYFDGRHVFATNYTWFVYNPEKRELAIDILPAKESYDPGDTAGIAFHVTDRTTGTPAADTTLVAAVVDEAVFAIEEQTPDFLNRLYRWTSSGSLKQYTSYDNHHTGDGGRGGGGPNPFVPRTDFQDTAAFMVLTTDADGRATLDVPLPDNLTSWRVTALAFSPDKKAGDTKDNFNVSKDFFITTVLPPRLLEGDDLVFTVSGAGRTTQPDDLVTYSCTIEGETETFTAEGKAGDATPIAIPVETLQGSRPAGEGYSITLTGRRGNDGDAVTLPLQVVKSGVNVTVSRQMPLSEAAKLESTTWPVTIGFYDKEHELEADILSYLARNEGLRADQRIARRFVMERMRDSGIDPASLDYAILTDEFRELCPDGKYYRLFPYGENSAVLTARVKLALSDEEFHAYPLEDVLLELPKIEDPSARASVFLIYSDYNDFKDLDVMVLEQLNSAIYTFQDKLYLVAALAQTGDTDDAMAWYTELVGPLLNPQTDANGNALLSVKRDGVSNAIDTAAALNAAITLGLEDADGMVRYLLTEPSTDELFLLEMVYYLRQAFPKGDNAQLAYTLNGAEQKVELRQGTSYRSFSREQLAQATFKAQGDVWVAALYTAYLDEAMDRENQGLTLTKTIVAEDGGVLRQGTLAKITLHYEAPVGVALDQKAGLALEDYIPTGMRYEALEPETGWHTGARNDQRVTFTATLDGAGDLVYYARCVAPGSYVGESAFIRTANGSLWGASQRQTVQIEPK